MCHWVGNMQIYKTKTFTKWQKKEGISDKSLYLAVSEMKSGLIDATLGSGIYKKRVAKSGFGKRGSYRTIVASKINNIWFYIFGFAKNDKDNISEREKQALIEVAQNLLELSNSERKKLMHEQKLYEVNDEKE